MIISKILAACDPAIGCVTPPDFIKSGIDDGKLTGIMVFLNSILKLIFIVGGLWGFINLILAGYQFMNAGGDAKNVTKAWDKIWQSLLGLLIIVSSFLIAAIMGMLLYGKADAILKPTLGIK